MVSLVAHECCSTDFIQILINQILSIKFAALYKVSIWTNLYSRIINLVKIYFLPVWVNLALFIECGETGSKTVSNQILRQKFNFRLDFEIELSNEFFSTQKLFWKRDEN